MRVRVLGLLLPLLTLAQTAEAQIPASATAQAPAPARLAKARALFTLMHLDTMMRQSMDGAMAAVKASVVEAAAASVPGGRDALARDPALRAKVDRGVKVMTDAMPAMLQDLLTPMLDSVTVAYARQLTDAELDRAIDYYRTPEGQSLLAKVPAIMRDPAVVDAQQRMMRAMTERMPALAAKAKAAMDAAPGDKK